VIGANPRPRKRPTRYLLSALLSAGVVLVLVANSLLDYVFLDSIPTRATLFGLLAIALVALATYILTRAFDRDPATRRRHLIRGAVLLGMAALLWLLLSDLFVFAESAGPFVALVVGG